MESKRIKGCLLLVMVAMVGCDVEMDTGLDSEGRNVDCEREYDNECLSNDVLMACRNGRYVRVTCTAGCETRDAVLFNGEVVSYGACVSKQGCDFVGTQCVGGELLECENGIVKRTPCLGECIENTCVLENACEFIGTRCVGGELLECENGIVKRTPCLGECIGNECIISSCEEGARKCLDDKTVVRCEAGMWVNDETCSGECREGQCHVNDSHVSEKRCSEDYKTIQSLENGEWVDVQTCGFACVFGECLNEFVGEGDGCKDKPEAICTPDGMALNCWYNENTGTDEYRGDSWDGSCTYVNIDMNGNTRWIAQEKRPNLDDVCEEEGERFVMCEANDAKTSASEIEMVCVKSDKEGFVAIKSYENGFGGNVVDCADAYGTSTCNESGTWCAGHELTWCWVGTASKNTCVYDESNQVWHVENVQCVWNPLSEQGEEHRLLVEECSIGCVSGECATIDGEVGDECNTFLFMDNCRGDQVAYCDSSTRTIQIKECEGESVCMNATGYQKAECYGPESECSKEDMDSGAISTQCEDKGEGFFPKTHYRKCTPTSDGKYHWVEEWNRLCSEIGCKEDMTECASSWLSTDRTVCSKEAEAYCKKEGYDGCAIWDGSHYCYDDVCEPKVSNKVLKAKCEADKSDGKFKSSRYDCRMAADGSYVPYRKSTIECQLGCNVDGSYCVPVRDKDSDQCTQEAKAYCQRTGHDGCALHDDDGEAFCYDGSCEKDGDVVNKVCKKTDNDDFYEVSYGVCTQGLDGGYYPYSMTETCLLGCNEDNTWCAEVKEKDAGGNEVCTEVAHAHCRSKGYDGCVAAYVSSDFGPDGGIRCYKDSCSPLEAGQKKGICEESVFSYQECVCDPGLGECVWVQSGKEVCGTLGCKEDKSACIPINSEENPSQCSEEYISDCHAKGYLSCALSNTSVPLCYSETCDDEMYLKDTCDESSGMGILQSHKCQTTKTGLSVPVPEVYYFYICALGCNADKTNCLPEDDGKGNCNSATVAYCHSKGYNDCDYIEDMDKYECIYAHECLYTNGKKNGYCSFKWGKPYAIYDECVFTGQYYGVDNYEWSVVEEKCKLGCDDENKYCVSEKDLEDETKCSKEAVAKCHEDGYEKCAIVLNEMYCYDSWQ